MKHTTDFGYQQIPIDEKTARVKALFNTVADKYDVMNDCLSLGLHRRWKQYAVQSCLLRAGDTVLDVAAGTGDLAAQISPLVGDQGRVIFSDINQAMLDSGRRRLLDKGIHSNVRFVLADAEDLPFSENIFDIVIIGFGLRNVTHKERALGSFYRVLKPGGKLVILEFSHPASPILKSLYDAYSFKIMPKLGRWIAKDESSYRYLAESIRMHPDPATLVNLLQQARFEDCAYQNLNGGIVALHHGYKY